MKHHRFDDTIVALSTPPGIGGVGIIRVSGQLSFQIILEITKKEVIPRKAVYSNFYDEDENVIDQGIVLFFKSPNSFTGEDVVEFHCHGGPIILDCMIERLLQLGCRIANPGEFSRRAFLNGKMDLTQAEAVADLISASSRKAAKLAIRSLQGEFSTRINNIVEQLILLRAMVEANIDFSTEEITIINTEQIETKIDELTEQIDDVLHSAEQGSIIRNGVQVAIVGKPNVGKSSLLNYFSGRNSAIVTHIPGTTRDVLREFIQIDGVPIHLVDTAGLRESKDVVEIEGIRRSWQEINAADIIIIMVDCSNDSEDHDNKEFILNIISRIKNDANIIIVKNKIDIVGIPSMTDNSCNYSTIFLSVKTLDGLALLKKKLLELAGFQGGCEGLFLARRRHIDAIRKSKQFLLAAKENICIIEFLAEELRLSQKFLSEVTGEVTNEDILDRIFLQFCIGK